MIKKSSPVKWDEQCEVVFPKIKFLLASPLVMTRLVEGKELWLYLVVSNDAIRIALIQETPNLN